MNDLSGKKDTFNAHESAQSCATFQIHAGRSDHPLGAAHEGGPSSLPARAGLHWAGRFGGPIQAGETISRFQESIPPPPPRDQAGMPGGRGREREKGAPSGQGAPGERIQCGYLATAVCSSTITPLLVWPETAPAGTGGSLSTSGCLARIQRTGPQSLSRFSGDRLS